MGDPWSFYPEFFHLATNYLPITSLVYMTRKYYTFCCQFVVCDVMITSIFGLVLYLFQAMLIEESDKFPKFCNMQTLTLLDCFLDNCDLYEKLEALGTFLQNAPCLKKLTLQVCMVLDYLSLFDVFLSS